MKNLVSAVFLFAGFAGFAQTASSIPANIRATNTIDRLAYLRPSDLTYGIPLPPKKIIGDGYLSERFKSGTLMLYGTEKLVDGYPIRYDIIRDEMEIKSTSGVKVIQGTKIKSFVWVDSLSRRPQYFVNTKDFETGETPMIGFFQILADGKMPLLKKTDVTIKEANYSIQFDVGNRDDQILKKSTLYYAVNGKVAALPSKKKTLLPLFGEKRAAVEKFISVNQLNLKEHHHIEQIFVYYNSL